ncbi:MAG: hypothetical protein EB127_07870, partial [Alphaproteobacteria bacterium]|nr:hypothetical protein [Alphaproteobacteria bacterium]
MTTPSAPAIIRTTSGGEASRPKHFSQTITISIMFKFQSSAIERISDVQDGKVVITFNGGRDYTYKVSDPTDFVEQLQRIISSEESVGKFINSAIR